MTKAQLALEHFFWKQLKKHGFENRQILVACSGGADSVALALLAAQVVKKENLFIAYIHHGDFGCTKESQNYRLKAQKWVEHFCAQKKLNFCTLKYQPEILNSSVAPNVLNSELKVLSSEKDLRDWRRQALILLAQENNCEAILTGHHLQDVFETRFLRLIRGVSVQSFKAIRTWRSPWLRLLLDVDPTELKKYLLDKNQDWIEDPSNKNTQPLRNWLRNTWLPLLEEKQPGAGKVLKRSFNEIVSINSLRDGSSSSSPVISRKQWESADNHQKKNLLRTALFAVGIESATIGQIEEVMKRLDNRQKVHSFDMKGFSLRVDELEIVVFKRS